MTATPSPTFRLQFETRRMAVDERRMLCLVLPRIANPLNF